MKRVCYSLIGCVMYSLQAAQVKPLFTKEGMSSQEWRAVESQIHADAQRIKASEKFIAAALKQNIGKMQEALTEGADVNAQTESDGRTALHIAIDNNNIPMITFLLDHDSNLTLLDDAGRSLTFMFGKQELVDNLGVISAAAERHLQRTIAKNQQLTRQAFQRAKQEQEQADKQIKMDQSA